MDTYLPLAAPNKIAELTAQLVPTDRAIALTHGGEFFAFLPLVLHLGVPWLLLTLGLSAGLRDRAARGADRLLRLGLVAQALAWEERSIKRLAKLAAWDFAMQQQIAKMRVFREWDPVFVRTASLYAFGYALIHRLVRLPFNYAAYRLEVFYGLKHESLLAWLQNSGDQWQQGLVVNTAGGVLLLGLIRFSPRRWPSLLALFCACVGLLFLRLPPDSPSGITPLPGGSYLASRLHLMAANTGVPNAKVLVDGSGEGRRDLNGSARYEGRTPTITLNWKLLNTQPETQIETTVAHEIGHCVHQDDLWMFLPTAIGIFIAFPFIRWFAERLLKRFGRTWGIHSLADPAALPVLLLCFHLVTLFTDPLANAYSRALERRADAYELAVTRDRLPMARQFVGFSQSSGFNAAPPEWFVFLFWDHPSDSERLQYALRGQPDSEARDFAKFW